MVGLRKIRLKKGYTQIKVAMDLNLTQEAISNYENGKRQPSIEILKIFSEYYKVSIDYLVYGYERKF